MILRPYSDKHFKKNWTFRERGGNSIYILKRYDIFQSVNRDFVSACNFDTVTYKYLILYYLVFIIF